MPSSDSRTADVNHDTVGESRSAAELAVRRYVPNSLRPDQWAAISEFTIDIALRLGASHPKRAIESMRHSRSSFTGRAPKVSRSTWS